MELEELSAAIIGAAMRVHSRLGPGLLESVYQACLKHELLQMGFRVESEVWLPIIYDTLKIDGAYKADLVVEDLVIIELKAVEQILRVHKAQLLSYLKLSGRPVGLILNFNVVHLREGICRMTNRHLRTVDAGS